MTKHEIQTTDKGIFFDVQAFEHAQRLAKLFADASMVPDHFKRNIGNCLIALNFAARTKIDPFMCMQNMYVVAGRPGIESKFAIALVNGSGKFSPLQYELNDDKTACHCYATRKADDEKCVGPTVSIEMAKAEGWMQKKGSKWQTMPELMLRYRAAMFWARTYAPETLLGMLTVDELTDVYDVEKNKNGTFEVVSPADELTEKLHGGDS